MDVAPLAGVIISAGKKLAVHQTEYNSIVAEVGETNNGSILNIW